MSLSESSFGLHDQTEDIEPFDAVESGLAPDFEPNTVEVRFVADALVGTLIASE